MFSDPTFSISKFHSFEGYLEDVRSKTVQSIDFLNFADFEEVAQVIQHGLQGFYS